MAGLALEIVVTTMTWMRQRRWIGFLFAATVRVSAYTPYSPNLVDPSFVNHSTTIQAVAPLPSGKILVVGGVGFGLSGIGSLTVSRLNQDGTLDTSFGPVGAAIETPEASDSRVFGSAPLVQIAAQSDGKAVITGNFNLLGGLQNRYVRLTSDGTVDGTFIVTVPSGAGTLVPLPNGEYWNLTARNGAFSWQLLTTSGAADAQFGAARHTPLPAAIASSPQNIIAALDSDGRCWVGVNASAVGSSSYATESALFRLTPDGALDPTLPPGEVFDHFAFQALIPTGTQMMYTGTGVALASNLGFGVVGRLNADGSSDPGWPECDLYGVSSTTAGAAVILPDTSVILLHLQTWSASGPLTYSVEHVTAANQVDPNDGGFLAEGSADTGGIWQAWALSASQLLVQGAFSSLNGIVTPGGGSVDSPRQMALARLNLDSQFAATRLVNLSVLGTTSATAPLTLGLVVGGSGAKKLLLRSSGPALIPFGIASAVADPQLGLYSGSAVVAANDNWSDTAEASVIAGVAQQVGAFPFPNGSKDAALVATLGAGNFTVQATAHGAAGTTLTEAYDADPAPTDYSQARLLNCAALTQVGAGQVAAAGLIVSGPNAERVLIRASGPALKPFGIGGAIPDPVLTLVSGGTVIATNAGWSILAASPVGADAQAVGAFPFAPGSADCALIAILPAGGYTAQVSSASGTSGLTLIEAYELPSSLP